jgi:hypothetical protein
MDTNVEDRKGYLEASKRVRETFARHELANVLQWAFSADEISAMPEDQLEDYLYGVRGRIAAVDPVWTSTMDALRRAPAARLRADLAAALAHIRQIASMIASGLPSPMVSVPVRVFVTDQTFDRDGKPRWMMQGRLRDALVWTALRLFSEVPRSLVRTCGIPGCPRVYVAQGPQKYCGPHQMEALRAARRRAVHAFRARAKKKGRKKP